MRIQHNIAALNSYRQLTGNNSALSKNLEKLSSGYRINRAGDDAAGLAISEKMRAQIKGLEVAQKNANDGISLVQTAEGALTEVHSMLNRMVELATQSANGTYDNETSRANLQKEVDSLLEEIDRISQSTNFNSINLLDGSMNSEPVTTGGEKSDVPILQNEVAGETANVGTGTILHKEAPTAGKTEITVDLHNLQVKGEDGDKFKLTVGDKEIEVALDGTGLKDDALANAIVDAFNNGADTKIGGQDFAAEVVDGGVKFVQVNDPVVQSEVVNPNVAVKAEVVSGSKKVDFSGIDAAFGEGTVITVGGETITIGTNKTIADLGAAGQATDGGTYKVAYADGKLSVTMADGTAVPDDIEISYVGYRPDQAATIGAISKPGTAAVAAKGKVENFTPAGTTATEAFADGITIDMTQDPPVFANATGTNYKASNIVKNADGSVSFDIEAVTAGEAGNKEVALGGKDITFAGGKDAVAGKLEYDLSSFASGDKIVIGANEYESIEDLAAKLTAAGTSTITAEGNKIVVTNTAAANPEAAPGEPTEITATTPIKILKAERGTLQAAEKPSPITGTYNVQSTVVQQGAPAGADTLASTKFKLTADMIKDGNQLTIGKETYTFKVGADSQVAAGENVIDLSTYKEGDAGLIDAAGQALQKLSNDNDAFTIGYADKGEISIHEKAGQTDFTKELTTVEGFDDLVYMTTGVKTTTGKSLTLQVGDTADDFQKVTLDIQDMSSSGLNIKGINIGTQEGASAAIKKIKEAINTVSSVRGDLGAVQNRLEHTINNLGVTTENLTAAESRIRDTDMAEEMMNYTKNNILVQAAQAMLAQANTVPQGVLQLLQ